MKKLTPVIPSYSKVDDSARVQKIQQQAIKLFEDETEAERWLSSPKEAFNGQTPYAVISTKEGFEKVQELLYQAAYGIFG